MSRRSVHVFFWLALSAGIVLTSCATISCWRSVFGGYATPDRAMGVGFLNGYLVFDTAACDPGSERLTAGFFGSFRQSSGPMIRTFPPSIWGWNASVAAYQYSEVGGLHARAVYLHATDLVVPLGLAAVWLHRRYVRLGRKPTAFPVGIRPR